MSLSIKELEKKLRKANEEYYKGNPVMTDDEFDSLFDELETRQPNNPFLTEVRFAEVRKFKLPCPMPSLDKIRNNEKGEKVLKKFYGKEIVLTPKLDGISALLYKEDDRLIIYSHADQLHGQIIQKPIRTRNAKNIPDKMGIRGELIMSYDKFKKWSKKYSNPRNLVAGQVNSKKYDKDVLRDIDFIAYSVYGSDLTYSEQLVYLEKLKIKCVPYLVEDDIDFIRLEEIREQVIEEYRYPQDGVVFGYNDILDAPKSRGNPKDMYAYKMDNIFRDTKVKEIVWQLSKDNKLKPVIIVEKTIFPDVVVNRLTGKNAKFIETNKIGKGALIRIKRSGEVIPELVKVLKTGVINYPVGEYEWDKNHIDYVSKEENNALPKAIFFMKTMDIKNWGGKTLEKIIEDYDTIPKILALQKSDLKKIEGVQERMADKLYAQLQTCKSKELHYWLTASNCFPNIGKERFKIILNKIPDLCILKYDKKLVMRIQMIDGFSEILAKQIVYGLNDFMKFWNKLPVEFRPKLRQEVTETKFDKSVVLSGFRSKELEERLNKLGYKVSNSVSKNTSYVIVKDKSKESGKTKKAKELNVKIITEDEI